MDEKEQAAWNYALRLLNYRERSRRELVEKLEKRKFSGPTIKKTLDRLDALDLIDDEKFARLWVRSRIRFKPRASWLIRRELQEKGVDGELAGRVLEEEIPSGREEELARELAEERFRRYRKEEPVKARRKLYAFLARRGFSPEIIWKCVDSILTASED